MGFQLANRFIKVSKRGTGYTIGTEAEENFVEIEFQDFLFGIGRLDALGENGFLDFAVDCAVTCEEEVLCNLLRDGGRTAWPYVSARKLVHSSVIGCLAKRQIVYAGVVIEGFVLSRDEGVLHAVGDRLNRKIEPPLLGIFADQLPVSRMNTGGYRRLVTAQNLVIRQIIGQIADIDRNDDCDAQGNYRANAKKISE